MAPEAPKASGAFEVVRSRTVFSGRLLRVDVDTIRECGSDGNPEALWKREIVVHPGAVAVVALTRQREVVFVRQYRHAARSRLLELPAGTREPGEAPEATARRELAEETGYRARTLRRLGAFFSAPGFSTEKIHLFRADGVTPGRPSPEPGEDIEVVRLPLAEARRRAARGEFEDAKTLAGLAALFLGEGDAP